MPLNYGLGGGSSSGATTRSACLSGLSVPTTDLNFVALAAVPSSVTVSRASGATYFDATGTMQTAAANVGRVDYGGLTIATGSGTSVITQPAGARVNWIEYSRPGINATNWTFTVGDTIPSGYLSWDGSNNACAFTEGSTTEEHFVQFAQDLVVNYTIGAYYTFSAYVKNANAPTGLSYFRIRLVHANGAHDDNIYFNLSGAGSYGTVGGQFTAATINAVGNGWYRISGTYQMVAPTAPGVTLSFRLQDGVAAPGLNGIAFYFDSVQFELGNTPTAFIPTNGSPADGGAAVPLGLLVEEQRTNGIRNPRGEGASGATPPTYWGLSSVAGLTATWATSTESGLPGVDFTVSGTATANGNIIVNLESGTSVAASNGQTWSYSPYLRLLAGTLPGTPTIQLNQNTSGGSGVTATTTTFAPTSASLASQRAKFVTTLAGGGTVGAVQPYLIIPVANNQVVSFTLRIGAPQLELGAFATSIILPPAGSPAASTRAADSVSAAVSSNVNQGSMACSYILLGTSGQYGSPLALTGPNSPNTDYIDIGEYTLGTPTAPEVAGAVTRVSGTQTGGSNTFLTTINAGSLIKQAANWAIGSVMGCALNGATAPNAVATTVTSVPSVNTLQLAAAIHYQNAPCLWMQRARLWPRALSATELQNVTT